MAHVERRRIERGLAKPLGRAYLAFATVVRVDPNRRAAIAFKSAYRVWPRGHYLIKTIHNRLEITLYEQRYNFPAELQKGTIVNLAG